jgi:signal transduction histidine kinase
MADPQQTAAPVAPEGAPRAREAEPADTPAPSWLRNGRAVTVLLSGAVLLSVAGRRLWPGRQEAPGVRPGAARQPLHDRARPGVRRSTSFTSGASAADPAPPGLPTPGSTGSAVVERSVRSLFFRSWPLLTLAFSSLVLLIVISGVVSQRKAREIYTRVSALNEAYRTGQRNLEEVRGGIHISSVLIRDYLLDISLERAPIYRQELFRQRDTTAAHLARLEHLVDQLGPDAEPRLAQLRREVDAYWESLDPVFEWTEEERRARATTFLRRQVVPRRDAALEIAREIASFHDSTLVRQQADLLETEREYTRFLTRTVTVSALLGLGVAFASIFRVSFLERRSSQERERAEHAEHALRRLSHDLVQAQEEERRVISRELHDEVGQMLTGLRMEIKHLRRLYGRPRDEFETRLNELGGSLEHTVHAVRDIAMGLRPSMLDDLGLGPALEWQAREFARRHDIPVTVDIAARLDALDDAERTAIYRIVQEALTNCARHARARAVRISLRQDGDRLHLTVHDDGAGFVLDPPSAPGVGLVGMAERAREIGAALTIESAPGAGTSLRVDLPFAPPAERRTASRTA